MREFTAVSLFCGAGGRDIVFDRAGYKTSWANDFDADACKTHQNWSKAKVVCGDISKVDFSTIPVSDVILGGFPCQGFSLSGPRKIDDSRNVLYKHYVDLVRQNKPKAFIGENVKGLLTMGNGQIIDAIVADFAECGYDVFYKLVNAKNFGVPQDRERVIIIGFRKDLNVTDFDLPDTNGETMTLRDAIGNMPPAHPQDVCNAPFSSRYMSRNRKRGWDDVAYTVPAMAKQVTLWPGSPDMTKVAQDLWAFGTNGITRRLSWKEAAAIQTFPPNLNFHGNLTSIYKQIGNAVPVKLAEFVANYIKPYLRQANN
jgi:DNA (cytosine-5)-methyltransferase 1